LGFLEGTSFMKEFASMSEAWRWYEAQEPARVHRYQDETSDDGEQLEDYQVQALMRAEFENSLQFDDGVIFEPINNGATAAVRKGIYVPQLKTVIREVIAGEHGLYGFSFIAPIVVEKIAEVLADQALVRLIVTAAVIECCHRCPTSPCAAPPGGYRGEGDP
jgi:hypothetical protein